MSVYTKQVQYLHKQVAPMLPVDAFVELLEPQKIGLTSKDQFYSPVRFAVQVAGPIHGPAGGAMYVDVPVHANPQWYADMKQRFAGMLKLGK